MPITFSHRIITIAAGAAIAIGAQFHGAQPGPGTSAAVPQNSPNVAAQAAAVRYWTPTRMNAALQSAPAPTTTRHNLVLRSVSALTSKPVAEADWKATLTSSTLASSTLASSALASSTPASSTLASSIRTQQPWLDGNTAGKGLRWTHNGAVSDAAGKIFFTLGGQNYVCSGTLVGGQETRTVLTAAHCVTGGVKADGAVDWATNWLFVPGYHDGQMPYGEYTAQKFFVTKNWTGPSGNSEKYDVAFVRLAVGTPAASGARTPPPPSGLPIAFASSQDTPPTSRAYVFGYPSLAPYSGMDANYCAGSVGATAGSLRTACEMTAGDSGGPWLAGFRPTSGTGTVVAVTTYKWSNDLGMLYGAVLGPTAHALYAQAAGLSTDPAPLG